MLSTYSPKNEPMEPQAANKIYIPYLKLQP